MQFSFKYGISRQLVREKLIMDFHFIYDELMYHSVRKVLHFTIINPEKSLFFLLNSRCNNEIITERSEGIIGIKKALKRPASGSLSQPRSLWFAILSLHSCQRSRKGAD